MKRNKNGLKRIFIFVCLFAFVTLLIFCQKQTNEAKELLDPPVLLASPADTLVEERGIDAIPESDAIRVEWLREDRFAGYSLFRRSDEEEDFALLKKIAGQDSFYVDREVELNKRYYYYLLGKDEKNLWSEPSDTVDYMLLPKAYNLSVSLQEQITFLWHVVDITPAFYILKLFDDLLDQAIWVSTVPSDYEGLEETATYNWDGRAVLPNLQSGRKYRWRIDIVGPAVNSGSESRWHKFVMP